MSKNNGISRRDFLRVSLGGLVATGLSNFPVFALNGAKADLIIHGVPILTVDASDSVKGAIALRGNRILAVDKDLAALKDFVGNGTKVMPLTAGSVTPGIIDVHNHIVAQSTTTVNWVDLIACTGAAGVRETIARWILEHDWAPGRWVRGVGYIWLYDKIAARGRGEFAGPPLLSRWDLDQVVEVGGKSVDLSRYSIWLIQLSGHYASLNGLAMMKAKIIDASGRFYTGSDATCLTCPPKGVGEAFSPEGHAFGSFFSVTQKDGVPQVDGMVFHHYAMEEFMARGTKFGGFPRLEESEMTAALKQRCAEFLRLGVTSIYDNNFRATSLLSAVRNFPQVAKPEEKLRITLYPYICHLTKGAFPAFDSGGKLGIVSRCPRFDGDWMRLIGFKLQLDAATMTGFTWEPNKSAGDFTQGKLNLWEYRDFMEIVRELDRRGAQISIHVIGDKSLDWTLDCYEQAGVGGRGRRHRLEHLPCVPDKSRNTPKNRIEPLYPRVKALDLIFCPQPGFILYYAAFMESVFGAGLGPKKEAKIYPRVTHSIPYRSAVEAGVRVALSSDNPCVPNPSPTIALWESAHRRTRPIAKEGRVFLESFIFNHPNESGVIVDETVDFRQALRGHTIDAAYCGFEEKIKGSLEPGKLADIVVWNRDIRVAGGRIPLMRIQDLKPILTIVDGTIAYKDESAGIKIETA
jgi:predicted amidohydrolase YtcJ